MGTIFIENSQSDAARRLMRSYLRTCAKFVIPFDPCHIYHGFVVLIAIQGALLFDQLAFAISSDSQVQIVPNSDARFSSFQLLDHGHGIAEIENYEFI